MFYDKDSMLEMFELSINKKQWKHVLITSELFGENAGDLSTKEVLNMHREWKEKIKDGINQKDAAYQINQGNIFVLVHESHIKDFQASVAKSKITSLSNNGGVSSSYLILSNEETEFLLKMS